MPLRKRTTTKEDRGKEKVGNTGGLLGIEETQA
jgi:hypothetical protein